METNNVPDSLEPTHAAESVPEPNTSQPSSVSAMSSQEIPMDQTPASDSMEVTSAESIQSTTFSKPIHVQSETRNPVTEGTMPIVEIPSSIVPTCPIVSNEEMQHDGPLKSTLSNLASAEIPKESMEIDDQVKKNSESLEMITQISSSVTPTQPVVQPLVKEEVLSSPARSITPMSEKLEQTSPVELMETSDGSVRIKGELDQLQPSSTTRTYRSRSSSQSSKSSKGSPGNQRSPAPPKSKKKKPPPKEEREHDKNDFYCWICHKEGEVLCCELCPRVMHAKCLHLDVEPEGDWFCPECKKIMEAECAETRSRAMSQLSIDQLALHLRYALQRMKTTGCEPFLEPVNTKEFTDYLDYVFHPMDLSTLEKNIKKRTYGCTEAFLADVKWILHNCIIYNGHNTRLSHIAKTIIKIALHEMSEIEVCPECYLNACRKRENWFCEPCKDIHVLVWAKLQGFPHWPAKALRIDKGMVDARFFGQHDRAWIPLSGCYLMSKEMPLPVKNKKKGRGPGAKGGLDGAMQEMQLYIDNVIRKTGQFEYAPPRTPLQHLDLCRKPAGQYSVKDGSSSSSKKMEINQMEQENVSAISTSVKKEMIEDVKAKQSEISKSSQGGRVLNLKIGNADEVSLTAATALPKKKSKVVTTSGAHPQKGARPYAPKKKASLAFLQKTIETCKASLRDAVEMDSDESSSESDSSYDDENDTSLEKSLSPDKEEKSEKAKTDGRSEGNLKKDGESDISDADLVIDIPEDEESSRKKNSNVTSLIEKGVVKVKKRQTAEGEKEGKVVQKTKSILLNKDGDATKKSSPGVPSRATGPATTNIKRKLTDDAASPASTKIRKVDGAPTSTKSDRPISSSQKAASKTIIVHKDKKRSNLDIDKAKKSAEQPGIKAKKEGINQQQIGSKKPFASEALLKKKSQVVNPVKVRSDEASDKTDLKSAAKLLAKKVMTRKQVPGQEKSKSNLVTGKSPSQIEKSSFSDIPAAKKLSSFTIPKHKPSMQRNESETMATTNTTSKITAQTLNHQGSEPSKQHIRGSNTGIPMPKIQKYNEKVMQSLQQVLVEMYEDMLSVFESSQTASLTSNAAAVDSNNAAQQVSKLRLELEQLKWMHKQEIAELQHNHDLTLAEIRQSLENEKLQMIEMTKRKCEAEKAKAVEETKKKQWCANCGREAIFYCCWNTSYCDYPCQQLHWAKHMATCSQARDRAAATSNTSQESLETEKPKQSSESKVNVEAKPTVTHRTEVMEIDKNDDDHSDTDMMVIDESIQKETPKPTGDLISPQSPDDVVADLKAKSKLSTKVVQQKADTSTVKTSSFNTVSEGNEKHAESSNVTLTTSSTIQPLAGAVVSALTSVNKSKPLPVKTTAPGISTASSASATKVVPSKLIDDIFSKVQKKESSVTPRTSLVTPSISTLKNILNSVSRPSTGQKLTTSDTAAAPAISLGPTTAAATVQDSKTHSSGFAISAIGDRLLKEKREATVTSDSSSSVKLTALTSEKKPLPSKDNLAVHTSEADSVKNVKDIFASLKQPATDTLSQQAPKATEQPTVKSPVRNSQEQENLDKSTETVVTCDVPTSTNQTDKANTIAPIKEEKDPAEQSPPKCRSDSSLSTDDKQDLTQTKPVEILELASSDTIPVTPNKTTVGDSKVTDTDSSVTLADIAAASPIHSTLSDSNSILSQKSVTECGETIGGESQLTCVGDRSSDDLVKDDVLTPRSPDTST